MLHIAWNWRSFSTIFLHTTLPSSLSPPKWKCCQWTAFSTNTIYRYSTESSSKNDNIFSTILPKFKNCRKVKNYLQTFEIYPSPATQSQKKEYFDIPIVRVYTQPWHPLANTHFHFSCDLLFVDQLPRCVCSSHLHESDKRTLITLQNKTNSFLVQP